MMTKIQKWGNSLGVRIPKHLAHDAQVEEGAAVDITVEEGRLVIVPTKSDRCQLARLLSQVTPENLHGEVEMGGPTGREVW